MMTDNDRPLGGQAVEDWFAACFEAAYAKRVQADRAVLADALRDICALVENYMRSIDGKLAELQASLREAGDRLGPRDRMIN